MSDYLNLWFPNFRVQQHYLEDLLKPKLLAPHADSVPVGLGWATRRCTCNKSSHNTDLDRPRTTFGNHYATLPTSLLPSRA